MTENERVEFTNRMFLLSDSFMALLTAIDSNKVFDTFIVDDYPFEKSFDEVCKDVAKWQNTMINKIRRREINTPKTAAETMVYRCPTCYQKFEVAPRCPNCGQLIANSMPHTKE